VASAIDSDEDKPLNPNSTVNDLCCKAEDLFLGKNNVLNRARIPIEKARAFARAEIRNIPTSPEYEDDFE